MVRVSKEVYLLFKALEMLEDELEFSVFYSFAESLESHLFCPGFTFEGIYYEIQYDEDDCMQVLTFGTYGYKDVGEVLSDVEIEELTLELNNI